MGKIEGADYFDDITRRGDAGVFSGIGIDDYEGVKESVNQDGLCIRMNCRVCGREKNLTLEWAELYIVGTNNPNVSPLMPPGWQYSPNNNTLYPQVPCGSCRDGVLSPHVTPDDARTRVNDALGRGLISQGQVQGWGAQCNAYRQQRGG